MTEGFNQQKSMFSQFWRIEVQVQSAGRVGFPEGLSLASTVSSEAFPSANAFLVFLLSYADFLFLESHQEDWIRAHPNNFILIKSPLLTRPLFQILSPSTWWEL